LLPNAVLSSATWPDGWQSCGAIMRSSAQAVLALGQWNGFSQLETTKRWGHPLVRPATGPQCGRLGWACGLVRIGDLWYQRSRTSPVLLIRIQEAWQAVLWSQWPLTFVPTPKQ